MNAAESDTISFGYGTWTDGTPLFTDGQLVTYKPVAGQFLGRNDATGNLIGALPAGSYRVQVVPNADGEVGMQIRLLDAATNQRIDLNDNPQFVTDNGKVCQVFSFDADEGTIDFNFPVVSGMTTPQQTIDFVNAQRIRYVQGFGCTVPGLVDGQYYYAVVTPANPGVIKLADSESQAQAADPTVQDAAPKLVTTEADIEKRRTLEILDVKPGLGLLFVADPQLPAGTPVVFRQIVGKPVSGVTDGVTYYAYLQANASFDPKDPQYFIGLRTAPDTTLPLINFVSQQTLQAGGTDLAISGIDANYNQIALALGQAAPLKTVDATQLAGGTPNITITTIPADSPQLYSTATGGTFSILIPAGGNTVSTTALPWNATADQIRMAINNSGVVGVTVTAVYGAGSSNDPWTIVGTGLEAIEIDQEALVSGGIYSRFTADDSQAVTTTATGGTFTLSFKVGDTLATTAALAYNATPSEIRAAIDAIGGVLAGNVYGTGAVGHPWMIGARVQPLKTGDPLVFHDAFGWTNPGLVDGRTYYAIVASENEQGKSGSVVVRLAATLADATAAQPVVVPLTTTTDFDAPSTGFMSGTGQSFTSAVSATGISLQAKLTSTDSIANKSANGGEPKLRDLLTRGDFTFNRNNWSSVAKNLFTGKKELLDDSPLSDQIKKLANGDENKGWTVSGSVGVLYVNNTAQVIVGPTAVLRTPGSVSVASEITEQLKSSVEGTVGKPNAAAGAVALAIDLVFVTNTSHAIIQAGAQVTGGDGVNVDSKVAYPSALQLLIDRAKDSKSIGSNAWKTLLDFINGKFGVDQFLVNSWVNAGIKQNASNKQIDVSIAGSGSGISLTNDCLAQIEDGALINQDTTVVAGLDQPVSITATTDISQANFAGLIYLDFSPEGYRKIKRQGKKFFESILVPQQGKNTLGASVGVSRMKNDTRALLGGVATGEDGKPLRAPAGPLKVTVGEGGLKVNAKADTLIVQLGQAGGIATGLGFTGTAAAIDAKQTTEAVIEGGADLAHKAVILSKPGTSGSVNVNAEDMSYLIPVAGGVMVGASKGFGVSVAIGLAERGVTARIGAQDDDPATNLIDISGTGNLTVGATAKGAITPSSIAGSFSTVSTANSSQSSQVNDANANLSSLANGTGEVLEKKGLSITGWGFSGAVSVAKQADTVAATVNHGGTMTAGGVSHTLTVSALNTTTVGAIAGALTIRSASNSDSVTAGITGAVSWL